MRVSNVLKLSLDDSSACDMREFFLSSLLKKVKMSRTFNALKRLSPQISFTNIDNTYHVHHETGFIRLIVC